MICPGCFKSYNKINNLPKEIPNCGHNICSKCLEFYFVNNILICKICKEGNYANNINDFPNNLNIWDNLPKNLSFSVFNKKFESISMLENSNDMIYNLKYLNKIECINHNKDIEAFCFDCKKWICVKCMLGNKADHKNHDILALENAFENEYNYFSKYYKKLNLVKNNYENYLKQNWNYEESLNKIKQNNINTLTKIMAELISKIRFEINIQINEIEEKYNLEKISLNDKLSDIKNKINNIDNFLNKIINYKSPILFLKENQDNHFEISKILNFENKFNLKNNNNIFNNKEIKLDKKLKTIVLKICEDFDVLKKKNTSTSNVYSNYSKINQKNKILKNKYFNIKSRSIKNKLKKDKKPVKLITNKKKSSWNKNNKLKFSFNKITNKKLPKFKVDLLKQEKLSDFSKLNLNKNSYLSQSKYSSKNKNFKCDISNINKHDSSFFSIYDKSSLKSSKFVYNFKKPIAKSKNLKERTISSSLNVKNLGHLLIFGGINNNLNNDIKTEVYNFSTKKCLNLNNNFNFYGMKIKRYQNLLYIFGGIYDNNYNSKILFVDFNDVKNIEFEFQSIEDEIFKRINFSDDYFNHKIYLTGGSEDDILSSSFCEFNFKTKKLINNENMLIPKKFHSISFDQINEDIYSTGGVDVEGNIINKVEKFNAILNKWELIDNMNKNRKSHSSIIIKNKLMVFGGFNGLEYWDSIEEYDIDKGFWILIKLKLTIPKAFMKIIFNEKEEKYIYLFGGYNGKILPEIEKLDLIKKDEFKVVSKLKTARYLHSITFIPKNIKF